MPDPHEGRALDASTAAAGAGTAQTIPTFPAGRAGSARAALRDATSAIHEHLQDARPFAHIARGELDREAYADLLVALSDYHGSLAGIVDAACSELELVDLSRAAHRRHDRLGLDLMACGVARRAAPAPVAIDSRSGWSVGCLYAVLGSTLGGKVVYRQLDYLFEGDQGRRFFAGSRSDGALWRRFCGALEDYGTRGERVSAMVAGATFAFAHFAACLSESR